MKSVAGSEHGAKCKNLIVRNQETERQQTTREFSSVGDAEYDRLA
jgi:hypothetical protein